MIEQLVNVLPADGSEIPFEQFIEDARAAGARPENWLKAKQQGKLETSFNGEGVHVVKRIITP